MGVQALILAAGTSSRFPGDKLLAELGSRKVIEHVLHAALEAEKRGSLSGVIVVTRPSCNDVIEIARRMGAKLAFAPDDVIALSLSLEAGLAAIDPQSSGALILLGDQPDISVAAIEAVTQAAEGRSEAMVRARYTANDQPGHPVYIGNKYFSLMSSTRLDRGFAEVARLHGLEWREVPVAGDNLDVDTAEDLERWQS